MPIDKGMDLRQLLIGRSLGRSLVRGLSMALVLLLGSWFVLVPVRAHGPSMTPTYGDGQLLLVNRLAYRFGEVRRGDVVAITLAGGKAVLVKRIIALPGERIRIEAGQVVIDDQPLDEPYCTYRLPWNILETQVGPDEVFVIGDNRSMLREAPRLRPRRPRPDPRAPDQLMHARAVAAGAGGDRWRHGVPSLAQRGEPGAGAGDRRRRGAVRPRRRG